MPLNITFSTNPYDILSPDDRWHPNSEQEELFKAEKFRFLPPLVYKIRQEVAQWRNSGYKGASETSRSLLYHWFSRHDKKRNEMGEEYPPEFRYYFAQREAVESVIYLYEVKKVQDKYDLMKFDSTGLVSGAMFSEEWLRFVLKLATGAGKTKIISLIIAWSFFNKTYEANSTLSRNVLLIAPNIIVLDRLRNDFDGLRIFREDPIIPENGEYGREWRSDFNMTLHIQDDVAVSRNTGNLFLTNIHRVYEGNDVTPSYEDIDTADYFLGRRGVSNTTDSVLDLTAILKDIDELIVINDEAHHVHDENMAWFKSIENIHHRLCQKDKKLSLQIDLTATPRHDNGSIFVQTICDYPLAEAIWQDVVKHPVLPDEASRARLSEKQTIKYAERYSDYIQLGVEEWRKAYKINEQVGKKSIIFIMTDDTKACDDVARYIEDHYSDLRGKVLTIHTNKNGEISENDSKKSKEELDLLRKQANEIDSWENPYVAVVSVMMLKEGWDVRNVTTIVGLRSFGSKNKILPEQALGRGLRKMYRDRRMPEKLSVVGTDAFLDFVKSVKHDGGPVLEVGPMGSGGASGNTSIVIEIDKENKNKDIKKLDIDIPVMTPRIYREYKNLEELNPANFGNPKLHYRIYSEEEMREIVFEDIIRDSVDHKTILSSLVISDFRDAIGFFTRTIMKDLRLFGGYDVLYGKVKIFVRDFLFDSEIDVDSPNTLRNLSEVEVRNTIISSFKEQINNLTIRDKGSTEIRDSIKISRVRPFIVKDQPYLIPTKSAFNKIIGDSQLELEFAGFLEHCPDVVSYAKNYMGVNFKLDYVNADGDISHYIPDFFVKCSNGKIYIVETKGNPDLDVPLKMERLKEWVNDINKLNKKEIYDYLYVSQEEFDLYAKDMRSFDEILKVCKGYK